MTSASSRDDTPSRRSSSAVAEGIAAAWSGRVAMPRVTFGPGSLARLGTLVRELHGSRALLVTDPGVRAAGHADRAEAALREAGIRALVFDRVEENPTTRHVEEAARAALAFGVDFVVGLGGGSAMDTAKGANFLLTNGGRMEDYWGTNRAGKAMLPSAGVPTTAGTGSEAQSYAVVEQEGSRRKMACGDDKARFRAVILDPDLTATLPRQVAAVSGLDAIAHAVESHVTTRRNPLSQMLSREAWRLLTGSFLRALDHAADAEARGEMLLGAFLAGAAIESSMLGAAHACANPLTSRFGVAHGAAVLLTLPHVVRLNHAAVGELYDDLLRLAPEAAGETLPGILERLRAAGGLPARLRDVGVPEHSIPDLAHDASEQWTGTFNPRPVGEAELRSLYEAAF